MFARTYAPPPADTLPPFSSLPQSDVERILVEACISAGVEIVRSAAVTGVEEDDASVRVADAAGHVHDAAYVIGADGARSAVRPAIGVAMQGSRSHHSYVVVDVDEDDANPLPIERVYHYEHPAAGGRNVLLVPFAGGWRADLQCRASDDPAAFSGERAGPWIGAVLGSRYASRIRWVSTYQFLQTVASAFTGSERRVLLIGEAAHLFPPFGARGLNSGVADADAAAAAVAAALGVRDPAEAAAAIDVFATERQLAARRNLHAARQALAATDSSHPWSLARRRLAGLVARHSRRAAAWLDSAPYGPRLRRTGDETGY